MTSWWTDNSILTFIVPKGYQKFWANQWLISFLKNNSCRCLVWLVLLYIVYGVYKYAQMANYYSKKLWKFHFWFEFQNSVRSISAIEYLVYCVQMSSNLVYAFWCPDFFLQVTNIMKRPVLFVCFKGRKHGFCNKNFTLFYMNIVIFVMQWTVLLAIITSRK